MTAAMFGFGYALVPLYEKICEVTGINILALGERRAIAVRNYLTSLGVTAARLQTISYGKERPVALGSDEQSWAKNRRAVTVTID